MKIRCKVMKRYLIPIIVVVLVLVSILLLGCNGTSPSEPKASDYQQRITELERQVAALTKQTPWQSTNSQSKPRVIEGDSDITIANKWEGRLQFHLMAGDRVEGEVSLSSYVNINDIVGEVKDPFGNQVVQTRQMDDRGIVWFAGFPWRFAFIASTDGEYELRISNRSPSSHQPTAHMRIVCYTDN